jgi:hypothetical protein
VPLSTAGCVSTTLDWDLFYETIDDKKDQRKPEEKIA